MALVDHLSKELTDAFCKGFQVTIDGAHASLFLVPICMKGDWPALNKIGNLTRHFGRKSDKPDSEKPGKGICHLCRADMEGHRNWHAVDYKNMVKMHMDAPVPWEKEPSLVAAVPLRDDAHKALFFRIDMFHTLHKGVMGDIAANAVAPCMDIC